MTLRSRAKRLLASVTHLERADADRAERLMWEAQNRYLRENPEAGRLMDEVAERLCESPSDPEAARLWARLVAMNPVLFGGSGTA